MRNARRIFAKCIQRFRGSRQGRLLLTFTPLSGITQVVSMFVPSFATVQPERYKANSRLRHVRMG